MLLIYYLDYRYYFLVIHKLRITYYNDVSSVKFCKSKAKKIRVKILNFRKNRYKKFDYWPTAFYRDSSFTA